MAVPPVSEPETAGAGAAPEEAELLPPEQAARFEQEHKAMLEEMAPQAFAVLHYAAVTILRRKDS